MRLGGFVISMIEGLLLSLLLLLLLFDRSIRFIAQSIS